MIEGCLDLIAGGCLHGWAMDCDRPLEAVEVTIHCDSTAIGTVRADIYRPDLERAGIGGGRHGFAFPLPWRVAGELTASVRGRRLNPALHSRGKLRDSGPHQRQLLSAEYLRGEGIEIGALDKPMWVPAGVRVRTVDRLPAAAIATLYRISTVVPVDYICDATQLDGIPDESQDFLVANHVLEHLERPLFALSHWLRVVRRDGILFLAIPDKRFTFDRDRPATQFEHLTDEFEHPERVQENRRAHYEEWVRLVEHNDDVGCGRLAQLCESRYPIHFHCWAAADLLRLFNAAAWLGYELDCYKCNSPECLVILRRV